MSAAGEGAFKACHWWALLATPPARNSSAMLRRTVTACRGKSRAKSTAGRTPRSAKGGRQGTELWTAAHNATGARASCSPACTVKLFLTPSLPPGLPAVSR
ncbi:hypothetical protein GCM10010275_63730 [Streptomyces litmocidini]|nr:hypothetical protein GCM10010275_63730 [Streptomyces litmocidini]